MDNTLEEIQALQTNIILSPDEIVNGGLLKKSLRERIKTKLKKAVITVAMLTTLLGPLAASIASASQKNNIDAQSELATDKVKEMTKEIKSLVLKKDFVNAEKKIDILLKLGQEMKDPDIIKKSNQERAGMYGFKALVYITKKDFSKALECSEMMTRLGKEDNNTKVLHAADRLRNMILTLISKN